MEFKLTEGQDLIRKNMREFAKKYVDPIAAEIDDKSRHPVEIFQKLAEGGDRVPLQYCLYLDICVNIN